MVQYQFLSRPWHFSWKCTKTIQHMLQINCGQEMNGVYKNIQKQTLSSICLYPMVSWNIWFGDLVVTLSSQSSSVRCKIAAQYWQAKLPVIITETCQEKKQHHKTCCQRDNKNRPILWTLHFLVHSCVFCSSCLLTISQAFHPTFQYWPTTKNTIKHLKSSVFKVRKQKINNCCLVGGWTNPFWKILVKLGSSSPNRGENKKQLKPPTSYDIYIYATSALEPYTSKHHNWLSPSKYAGPGLTTFGLGAHGVVSLKGTRGALDVLCFT